MGLSACPAWGGVRFGFWRGGWAVGFGGRVLFGRLLGVEDGARGGAGLRGGSRAAADGCGGPPREGRRRPRAPALLLEGSINGRGISSSLTSPAVPPYCLGPGRGAAWAPHPGRVCEQRGEQHQLRHAGALRRVDQLDGAALVHLRARGRAGFASRFWGSRPVCCVRWVGQAMSPRRLFRNGFCRSKGLWIAAVVVRLPQGRGQRRAPPVRAPRRPPGLGSPHPAKGPPTAQAAALPTNTHHSHAPPPAARADAAPSKPPTPRARLREAGEVEARIAGAADDGARVADGRRQLAAADQRGGQRARGGASPGLVGGRAGGGGVCRCAGSAAALRAPSSWPFAFSRARRLCNAKGGKGQQCGAACALRGNRKGHRWASRRAGRTTGGRPHPSLCLTTSHSTSSMPLSKANPRLWALRASLTPARTWGGGAQEDVGGRVPGQRGQRGQTGQTGQRGQTARPSFPCLPPLG